MIPRSFPINLQKKKILKNLSFKHLSGQMSKCVVLQHYAVQVSDTMLLLFS